MAQNKKPALPISIFHTGACMFGKTLYGIDQHGYKHSLTDPHYKIPKDCIINRVENSVQTHPEENLSKRMFCNLAPLIKIMSGPEVPIIKHHLPCSNYIIYGLNKYANSEMTQDALIQYIELVKIRSKKHKIQLNRIAKKNGLKIEFPSSLSDLKLEKFHAKNFVAELFTLISFENDSILSKHQIPRELFFKIINYLSSRNSSNGILWKIIKEKITTKPDLINTSDLLQINYLDYSATIALIVQQNSNSNICSLMPSHEKHMALGYKNLFSEIFGSILCISYLPLFHVCIEKHKNSLFYLDSHLQEVNALLNTKIIKYSAFKAAALALDSFELAKYSSEKISKIIKKFSRTVTHKLMEGSHVF